MNWVRSKNQQPPSMLPLEQNQKEITFSSFDHIEISCLISYSQIDSSCGTVILLHGIRSDKNTYSGLSKKLTKIGYHTVAMDLRAHGQSGGQFCTFGVKEKKDISSLLDTLIHSEKLNANIGIWGQSLGGAIGLQSMATDKRIKFGIIESTFSSFESIVQDYFEYYLGFNFSPLTSYLTKRAGRISDFDPGLALPVEYCRQIDQPILIVHGSNDQKINIGYGRENFEHISSDKKEFFEVKDAGHLNLWEIGGEDYFNYVFKFIKRSGMDVN